MNPQGTKLCVAGHDVGLRGDRVHARPSRTRIAVQGKKPYWSTNSGDGRYCFISFSGDDRVSVVSYAQEKEIASIPVGDHPQRMRVGRIRCDYLGPRVDCTPPAGLAARGSSAPGAAAGSRSGSPSRPRLRIVVARLGRAVAARVVRRQARRGSTASGSGGCAAGAATASRSPRPTRRATPRRARSSASASASGEAGEPTPRPALTRSRPIQSTLTAVATICSRGTSGWSLHQIASPARPGSHHLGRHLVGLGVVGRRVRRPAPRSHRGRCWPARAPRGGSPRSPGRRSSR